MDRDVLNAGCDEVLKTLDKIDKKMQRLEESMTDERRELRKELDAFCTDNRARRLEARYSRCPREFPMRKVNR